MKISVVAPIYNEEGNVEELHRQILSSCKNLIAQGKISDFEIIFINDGSKDKSLELMRNLSPLRIIDFRKNFGQTAAIDAGIKVSTGDLIITIDGDLQNDPADFGLLIDEINKGFDVVSGWRFKRQDKKFRMALSRVANKIRKAMLDDDIHDTGCSLKAYRKECFAEVDLEGEMHRFIPAILKWHGFKISEVKVNHRPRVAGKSKYGNWKRIVKVMLDMSSLWFWRRYSSRPLHIFGGAGLFFFVIGALMVLSSIFDKVIFNQDLSDTALFTVALFCFLTGVILIVAGFLADISIKTYYRSNNQKHYSIREVVENK